MKADSKGSTPDRATSSQDDNKAVPSSAKRPAPPDQDEATLSSDSAILGRLTSQALASAELRQEKVEALRQAIQRGEYKVEPAQIADAMIRESN